MRSSLLVHRGFAAASHHCGLVAERSTRCPGGDEDEVRENADWIDVDRTVCFSSSSGGQLVFVDTGDMTVMSKQEHPDLSDVEWDPTGRYVTSSVNQWSAKVTGRRLFRRRTHGTLLF